MITFTSSVPGQRNCIVHKNISPAMQKKLFNSVGWNEQQMNTLLRGLKTMLKRFHKIAKVACKLKIEIDRYRENEVELSLAGFQINLTLTRNLEPEEITFNIVLKISEKLIEYCLSHDVPGISDIILIRTKPLSEIDGWIIGQISTLKLLLTFLPSPPFVYDKFCQEKAAVFFKQLMDNAEKFAINEDDLLRNIAMLAIVSVVEEKHGSNQIHVKFVQEFKELKDHPGLVNQALDSQRDSALQPNQGNWFYRHYQEFRGFCEIAFDSLIISL